MERVELTYDRHTRLLHFGNVNNSLIVRWYSKQMQVSDRFRGVPVISRIPIFSLSILWTHFNSQISSFVFAWVRLPQRRPARAPWHRQRIPTRWLGEVSFQWLEPEKRMPLEKEMNFSIFLKWNHWIMISMDFVYGINIQKCGCIMLAIWFVFDIDLVFWINENDWMAIMAQQLLTLSCRWARIQWDLLLFLKDIWWMHR